MHIIEATIVALNNTPDINDIIGIIIEKILYALEIYSHEYGNKCAPKTIANTITIFSGTALNTHITIKIYSI